MPPDEIERIKDYVKRRYKAACRVEVRQKEVIISVKSAALASDLRLNQQHLKEVCKLKKRLVLRIA